MKDLAARHIVKMLPVGHQWYLKCFTCSVDEMIHGHSPGYMSVTGLHLQ